MRVEPDDGAGTTKRRWPGTLMGAHACPVQELGQAAIHEESNMRGSGQIGRGASGFNP